MLLYLHEQSRKKHGFPPRVSCCINDNVFLKAFKNKRSTEYQYERSDSMANNDSESITHLNQVRPCRHLYTI